MTLKIVVLTLGLAAATGPALAGGCSTHCADGYTYSSESGTCVPKQVSS